MTRGKVLGNVDFSLDQRLKVTVQWRVMTRFVIQITAGSLLAVLLLVGHVAEAQHATPSEVAALKAYREGSFSRAVQLYTKALSETDDSSHRAQLHVSIAWTLFALGRQGEVDTHLRAALVEDPDLTLVPDYYTREFIDLFEATSRRARTAVRENDMSPAPDLEATLSSIGQRLEAGADLEGALADVERLMAAYPQDGRLLPLRAELLRRLGRDDEAVQMLHAYGTAGLDDVPPETLSIPDLILRANRLLDDGDVETAFGLLREAVARQPTNVAGLELMAEAAVRTGRWKDAEFALKSALGLQPDNLNLRLRLGGVYLAMDETSAARDIFQELAEGFPHSDRAWAALGLLDAKIGNSERARLELSRALDENPLLPEVQLAFGELLLADGEPASALQAFEAAQNLLRDDLQLTGRTGQALLSLGRADEALEKLRVAQAGGFKPPDIQRAFGLALVANGLFAEAERAIADIPADSRGNLELVQGYLLLERGADAPAEQALRRFVDIRPTDPAALNLLATAVYRQQRYSESVALLERATDLDPANETWAANLERARAALAAEALASGAEATRAAVN